MNQDEIIPSIVISAHALARIAAQRAQNEAPSAQWRVLSILNSEGGLRVGALAIAARTTQPGMTRLIGDLERAGLITRSPDPEDSRAIVVHISVDGIAAFRDWQQEFRVTLAPRFGDLNDSDWTALAHAAKILAAHSNEPAPSTGATE